MIRTHYIRRVRLKRTYARTDPAKIIDSLAAQSPPFTRRDVHIPLVRGRSVAVIGPRRAGKTTLLWQVLADRLAAGTPREGLMYFNFEDERLAGITVADLQLLVEEYYPGEEHKAAIEVCPVAGKKSTTVASKAGLAASAIPTLLVQGDNRLRLGCAKVVKFGRSLRVCSCRNCSGE